MGQLKVLPANIANMIAAGEVVQRPASVVKELMENAVDAGADRINVIVTDAGRTLIQVIDNGCGMSPADAVLCFERHATSKIASAEDLGSILTYGFRGEALPSIAAISDVTLRTRRAVDESGIEVRSEADGKLKTATVSCPVGANFAVRNIFYNTPARRKFLKSDNAELKHIIEEFTRVAITKPEIEFTLTGNGREIFCLKKAKSLKFRILDLLGSNVVGDIVDITANTTLVRISGFAGRPDSSRKTLGNQFFFVNGRFFRSPYLHKAVMKAYEEMTPEGLTPPYFIFLETDPASIDVNVHPSKTEIKFEDESVVFQILYASIRETLGKHSFGASIDFDMEGAVELPQLGRSFEQYRPETAEPSAPVDPEFNPFSPAITPDYGFSSHVDRQENYGALFEQKVAAIENRTLVIKGKYILTPAASGVMVINIRRAFERIQYERALKALSSEEHVTQTALFPVQVQTGVADRLLLEDNAEMLARLGFDIVPFGNDCVTVNGVPEGYSCSEAEISGLVSDITAILSENHGSLSEIMQQRIAGKFAAMGASKARIPSNPAEARELVDTLFANSNAELTSDGRRIICIVGIDEIDKKF